MLNPTSKKVVLAFHLILVANWIGCLMAILVVHISKQSSFAAAHYFIADKIIFMLSDTLIMNLSLLVALTGLVFSLFTPWSFFKFHLLTVKWVAIFSLAATIIFLAGPAINGMAAISDVLGEVCQGDQNYLKFEQQAVLYSAVQLFLLIVIVLISIFKPWGARQRQSRVNRKIIVTAGIVVAVLIAVSFALQYVQLRHFRHLPITEIKLANLHDGIYVGKVHYGFDYSVQVSIKNHFIEDIKILNNRHSFYAQLAEGIKHKIIGQQKIDIDTVTGATTTSKILLKAVEVALASANEQ